MPEPMSPRVLVAGIGNVFFGDDGFGVEVARRLASRDLPDGVRVVDVGIRTLQFAYDLAASGSEMAILVDAMPRGGPAGTLYVMMPDAEPSTGVVVEAHGVRANQLVAITRALGGSLSQVLIVGCEPACVDEGIGLSVAVATAVDDAADRVTQLASEWTSSSVS